MRDLDITSQLKAIESLKCALLSDIALLFEQLRVTSRENELDESFVQTLIHLYLLAKRAGVDFAALNAQAAAQLRRDTLEDGCPPEKQALLRFLS